MRSKKREIESDIKDKNDQYYETNINEIDDAEENYATLSKHRSSSYRKRMHINNQIKCGASVRLTSRGINYVSVRDDRKYTSETTFQYLGIGPGNTAWIQCLSDRKHTEVPYDCLMIDEI